jgi:hypothetical protein
MGIGTEQGVRLLPANKRGERPSLDKREARAALEQSRRATHVCCGVGLVDGNRLQVVEHDLVRVLDQADHIGADVFLALEVADAAEAFHVLAHTARSEHSDQ